MTDAVVKSYQKGDQIYAAGEAAGRFMKLCSGAVILFVLLEDGRRQIIDLAGPGDLLHFDLEGDLDHFAEALRPSEVVFIDGSDMAGDPDFVAYLLDQMRTRLSLERRHIAMLGRRSAQERVADFMGYIADRLGCPDGEIDLPMTRQQIADYLGLTLETVSRIFAKWERERRLVHVSSGRYAIGPSRSRHADGRTSLCVLLAA